MSSKIRVTRICQYCKLEFTAQTIQTRYCSHSCNNKDYKQKKRQEKLDSVISSSTNNTNPPIPMNPPDLLSQFARMLYESKYEKKEFLSILESCILIGVTEVTLRRWIKQGLIKTHRIGKKHLIQREVINKLLGL